MYFETKDLLFNKVSIHFLQLFYFYHTGIRVILQSYINYEFFLATSNSKVAIFFCITINFLFKIWKNVNKIKPTIILFIYYEYLLYLFVSDKSLSFFHSKKNTRFLFLWNKKPIFFIFLPKPKFRDRKEKEILRVSAAAFMIQAKDNGRRYQRNQTVKNRIIENFIVSANI